MEKRSGLQTLLELERQDKPFYVVLDLDRTLFKSNQFVEFVYQVLGRMGIEKIDEFQQYEKDNRGNTLDLLQELEAYFADAFSLGKFKAAMDELEPPKLVYDGVSELLRHFRERGIPFSIMTYGGESTQALKLMLFFNELGPEFKDTPYEITSSEKNKADYIDRTWVGEDGQFQVPSSHDGEHLTGVGTVVILDDKLANFATDNPAIVGVKIGNDGQSDAVTIEELADQLAA